MFKHLKFYYEYVLLTRCPWVKVDLSSQFTFKSVSIAFSFLIGKNVKVEKYVFPWFWCGEAQRRQVNEAHTFLGTERKVVSTLHGRWFSKVGEFSSVPIHLSQPLRDHFPVCQRQCFTEGYGLYSLNSWNLESTLLPLGVFGPLIFLLSVKLWNSLWNSEFPWFWTFSSISEWRKDVISVIERKL